jgi:hypothetical protein
MTDQRHKLALTETVGSVLWFVMDGFWLLDQALPAKAMVLPTLAINLLIFRFTPRSFSQMSVAAAMNSWLIMNTFWMVGDLDKDQGLVAIARVMFVVGLVLLALAVARGATRPEGLTKVLTHFRRLRI